METGEVEYVLIHRSRSTSEISVLITFGQKETEVSMPSLPYHLSKVSVKQLSRQKAETLFFQVSKSSVSGIFFETLEKCVSENAPPGVFNKISSAINTTAKV